MKQLESDVVVIAAGPSGLAAAVTAAERGASVIVFEKSNHTGGDALRANQVFAVESRLQRARQYTISREQAFQIWMNHTQWGVNARLVKKFIDKSASTIDWLEKMGVEFRDLTSHGPGNNYTGHIVWEKSPRPGLGAASRIIEILTNKAQELGVQIVFKTPARQILKEDGRVTGVVAESADGETYKVKTKAAIVGTGGTSSYAGPVMPGTCGDGLRMAKELGADVNEGTMVKFAKGGGMRGPTGSDDPIATVFAVFAYPHLAVNLLGERFMDEEISVTSNFSTNAIVNQKNHCAFTIFDEDTKNYFVEYGLEFPFGFGIAQFPKLITEAKNFEAELKQALAHGSDSLWAVDSIEELAAKTGINLNGLKQTIKEYNLACQTGRDEAFNKKARYLKPIKKPKFYIRKYQIFSFGLPEGIKTNHRTEVITKDFEVIPGLYAVGSDAYCNIHREIYPNVLPANALGFCFNSGRMAGENAVEYIKASR
jgi:fumarate reductase flavoprotein subunit